MAGWQSKPGPRRETGKSASPAGTLTLPVVGPSPTGMRRSQMSRWRALSLVGVHVLIIAHIAHWLVAGRTLSPVEPSEAMYTLNDGHLNAGFIFFAVSLLATLVLGRFVCGWGCHLVAYQDLCAWLLKKIGLKPKPFRSRIVIMAPFALAVYMFIWPSAYRLWMGIPRSPTTNHLMTGDFWATFPGPVIGVVSVLVCGFIIVYFLGSKGFCTYACPYGGFFRVADRFAPGRILVSDACEHCGHCTATCSSNVRVHEEVARYGMVVDPGCMKCMDCVSVCPNHALHFGFEKPSLAAKPRADVKTVRPYDFNPVEELMMVVGGVGALLALRGLYGQIPLLLAMALAAVTAYLGLLLTRMVHAPNVKLQRITFKRGGRWSRAGAAFGLLTASWTVLVVHGGVVQYHLWRGQTLARSAGISDEIWFASSTWWDDATEAQRKAVTHALRHFELVDSLGLLATPVAVRDSVRLHLAMGDDKLAEAAVRRLIALRPDEPDPYRGLAGIMRKTGRRLDAEASYRRALSIKPSFAPARTDLIGMLLADGDQEAAVRLYHDAIDRWPGETRWSMALARLLIDRDRPTEALDVLREMSDAVPHFAAGKALLGLTLLKFKRSDEAVAALREAVELDPEVYESRYNLGLALVDARDLTGAIEHLTEATRLDPDAFLARYNLAVTLFMAARPQDALPNIRQAIQLKPDSALAYGFLSVVLTELGDEPAAAEAKEAAVKLAAPAEGR